MILQCPVARIKYLQIGCTGTVHCYKESRRRHTNDSRPERQPVVKLQKKKAKTCVFQNQVYSTFTMYQKFVRNSQPLAWESRSYYTIIPTLAHKINVHVGAGNWEEIVFLLESRLLHTLVLALFLSTFLSTMHHLVTIMTIKVECIIWTFTFLSIQLLPIQPTVMTPLCQSNSCIQVKICLISRFLLLTFLLI